MGSRSSATRSIAGGAQQQNRARGGDSIDAASGAGWRIARCWRGGGAMHKRRACGINSAAAPAKSNARNISGINGARIAPRAKRCAAPQITPLIARAAFSLRISAPARSRPARATHARSITGAARAYLALRGLPCKTRRALVRAQRTGARAPRLPHQICAHRASSRIAYALDIFAIFCA